jgi:hypothetical protein
MMKKLILLLFVFSAVNAAAQTAAFNGYCTLGAAHATISGLNASNYQQGMIPSCTVTVYLTGTLTKATLYADAGGTPLTNSFTANTNASWLFYAATGAGYDVVMSGGTSPNTYPSPVTLTGLMAGGGSGGGVTSINSTAGAFTFSGAGVSCVGTSCTFTGGTGSGTVQNGTAYSPTYYPAGGGTVVTGVTPFSGLAYFSTSAPPAAASSAQIQTAIGASVYNAYLGYTPAHSGANSDITSLSGLTTPLSVAQGGIGTATSAPDTFFSNLGGSTAAPGFNTATAAQPALGVIGQTYNVLDAKYGAVGNGSTDDKAAVQAAFNACYAGGGGTVQFPGGHTYLISGTVNTFYGCGYTGGSQPGSPTNALLAPVVWGGCPSGGTYPSCNAATVDTITSITVASNVGANVSCTSGSFKHCSPAFPNGLSTPYYATVTATGTLPSVGDWMYLNGLTSTNGVQLNRTACSVAAVGSGNFTCLIPRRVTTGTYSDSGTATRIGVMFAHSSMGATSSAEIYSTPCTHLDFRPLSGTTAASLPDIAIYYGATTDSGSDIHGCQVQAANLFSVYYADGAYNTHWDGEWRSDGAGVAAVYLPLDYVSTLSLTHGEVDNNRASVTGSTTSGGLIYFDDSDCGNQAYVSESDLRIETNESITSGLGVHTGVACNAGTTYSGLNEPNVYLSMDTVTVAPGNSTSQGTVNSAAFVVSPALDSFFQINGKNLALPSSYSNSWNNFQGMNYANLINFQGSDGIITDLNYALPITRLYMSGVGSLNGRNPHQIIGDLSINNLFMNGVPASPWLQTDAAFTALPNGTTLHLGDIIEVPAVWKASSPRYNLYSVVQEGTTGTLNSGSTTCTTGIVNWLTVSSVTGLMLGQHINCGANTNMIIGNINASNPTAVLVYAVWSTSVGSPVTLSYSAPVLSPEIQFPIKAAAAPASGTWIQGDQSQNSSASANGIAGYVNVAGGTPGTWAAIPAFDASGKMAAAQLQSVTGTGNQVVLSAAPTITNQSAVGTSATNPCSRTDYGYASANPAIEYCTVPFAVSASPTNNTQKVTIVTTNSTYSQNQAVLDIDLVGMAASADELSHWQIVGDTTNGFSVTQHTQGTDPLNAGVSQVYLSAVTVTNATTYYFYISNSAATSQTGMLNIKTSNIQGVTISSITVGAVQSLSPTRAGWAPYGGTAALATALVGAVANTTFTTSTASVAANTCNSTVQVAMTGVTTSMAFSINPSADASGATGWGSTGGLVLDVWPTAGYLNYKICNQTASSITPTAVTFNVGAR